MPVAIGKEEFMSLAEKSVAGILTGTCDDAILLAVDPIPHTVRIVAKLSGADFQPIKFPDLYISIQKIASRYGERHVDPATHAPHRSEFKLYDPYFETLEFVPVEPGKG